VSLSKAAALRFASYEQNQPRSCLPWLVTPIWFPLAVVVQALNQQSTGHKVLCCDPAAMLGASTFIGALSTSGIFIWAPGAGGCFLAYAAVCNHAPFRIKRLFLAAGVLILLLWLDEAFLLVGNISSFHLGSRERYVVLGYLAVAAISDQVIVKFFLRNNFQPCGVVRTLRQHQVCLGFSATHEASGMVGG
jgi:hypothetical protein